MCGIAGYVSREKLAEGREKLQSALVSLRRRGPDGSGIHIEDNIGFAHVRLAIQDLTSQSHQPQQSSNAILSYNGEIYNFIELRVYLENKYSISIKDTGDLVVLQQGLERESLDFIKKVNGDFSISFYDKKKKELYLIRDRLGIKPLYYTVYGNTIYYASEIKAFNCFAVPLVENKSALNDYFAFRYVRGEETAFKGIYRVPPGNYLKIDSSLNMQFTKYWSVLDGEGKGASIETISTLIKDSIKLRMRSQVSTGVLLSGGVDSSIILEEAAKIDNKLKAFTCILNGNKDIDYLRSKKLCERLNIEQSYFVHKNEQRLRQAINIIEEPIGDSIIGPLLGLMELSQKSAKVILSGEGADEVFAGYGHHYFLNCIDKIFPMTAKLLKFLLKVMGVKVLKIFNGVYPLEMTKNELEKIMNTIGVKGDLVLMYHNICEFYSYEERREFFGNKSEDMSFRTREILNEVSHLGFLKQLIYLELKTWLPNYNLLKLDKLSSYYSIEARVPYLDHRIVEAVFALPDKLLWSFFEKKPVAMAIVRNYKSLKQYRKVPFTFVEKNGQGVLFNKKKVIASNYKYWRDSSF